jgi:thymidylate kinase
MIMAYLMYEITESSYGSLINAMKNYEIILLDRYLETIQFMAKNYSVDSRTLSDIINNMPEPDEYIYLKVNPKTAYARITSLRTPGEGEELDEITQAADYYNSNAERLKFKIVDGERSQREVFEECLCIITSALNR